MMQFTEEQRKAMAGLCRIEIKRWRAASESNPNMRYMVELMEIALAELEQTPAAATAVPDGWTCNLDADAALVMLDRIDTLDEADDVRIEEVKLIIRKLAAAKEKSND